jgi:hypothetical protein
VSVDHNNLVLRDAGWMGAIENGELIRVAEEDGFAILIMCGPEYALPAELGWPRNRADRAFHDDLAGDPPPRA